MNTKKFRLDAPNTACFWTLALAAALLSGLLVGVEPVGGDPDRMYRPIKAELARSLAEARLPFWSDRVGLGFPLVAESHAAAFYPPNLLLYRFLSVPFAYRLSMFLHYLFMAGATYAYARRLKLTPYGASLAALSFSFCGFQSIHSSHEWSYHALPYLPLCLLLAERIMAEGRVLPVAGLGLAYGLQLTVGHFQVQSWTAGLVLATGIWRTLESPRHILRVLGVIAGLAWGAAIAAVQLGSSWELARFVGYDDRPFLELAFFGFPPAHWAELVVPSWLRGIPGGPEANYWYALGTTGYEACLYIGTIPLIFAFVGLLSKGGSAMRFWIGVTLATFILAVLPGVWLQGFEWVASLPGMGLFRAPGRFLALTSLGLALFAGHGLDRGGSRVLAWTGLALALVFAATGAWWVVSWSWRPDHVRELGGDRLLIRLAMAGGAWLIAAILAAAWLRGRVPAQVLLVATAAELGGLYYTSTTDWGWAVPVPGSSPILKRLAAEKDVGKVAGLLSDIPLRFGMAPLFPYTGFAAPPPHRYFSAFTQRNVPMNSPLTAATSPGYFFYQHTDLLSGYGATHGVWDGPVDSPSVEMIVQQRDETLDRLVNRPAGAPAHASWRLYRIKDAAPFARAVGRAGDPFAPIIEGRSQKFAYPFAPPDATRSEVTSWDGRTAIVDHDGSCAVVLNRMFYPGWTYTIDDGREEPVSRNSFFVQTAQVPGAGTHRVTFTYRPSYLVPTAMLSAGSLLLALAILGWGAYRRSPSPRKNDADRKDDDPEQHRLSRGVEGGGQPPKG
ncbi:hypothetical protein [Paludisphaera mucosa]|uniref:Bacterial membrane protein YfhO n=1 Tax=Paludisphaera mucosa TaxID=3030827 RepID=A0ABT6F644_9BACT|nr:hypothetical protein [Paludisphaera mucosa]MDG3003051.1 hypothetical protein [Paludisphaera mucosa]